MSSALLVADIDNENCATKRIIKAVAGSCGTEQASRARDVCTMMMEHRAGFPPTSGLSQSLACAQPFLFGPCIFHALMHVMLTS